MAKALLISYPGEPINPTTFLPDNGLASLASCLLHDSHKVKILDYGTVSMLKSNFISSYLDELTEIYHNKLSNSLTKADEKRISEIDQKLMKKRDKNLNQIGNEIIEVINSEGIDFVGFKSWMGDAYPGMLKLTEIIKKAYKKLPIIVGGPQVTSFGELMVNDGKNIDYFCYDEGEKTIIAFARYLEGKDKIQNIPNLLYKNKKDVQKNHHEIVANLDNLPFPNYDLEVYPAMGGNEKFKMIVIDESRRCYFSCPFCIESSKEKGKWRAKSPERIIEEIKILKNKFNVKLIRLGGQMTPKKLLEDISMRIIEDKIEIEFSSFSHITTMKDADFNLMRSAGLYSIFFGVESGSQRMLSNTLGKRTKVEDIESALIKASDAGIYTVASLIYPSPGDNEGSMMETINLLIKTRVKSAPVQFAGVYPKTGWAKEYRKYGFELDPNTYPREVIDYKIKNLFPPNFWKPLPVKIDGKGFFQYIQETGKMIYLLEKNGILTDITDEQALLAKHAGLSPREFRDEAIRIFYVGDWKRMKEIIYKVNEGKNDLR